MLETDHSRQLNRLLESATCEVQLPSGMGEVLRRRGNLPSTASDLRSYVRRYFPSRTILEFRETNQVVRRSDGYSVVITRDISRSGVGFLCHCELYPGERVVVWLTAGRLLCEVRRCIRRGSGCFEVGAVFEGFA